MRDFADVAATRAQEVLDALLAERGGGIVTGFTLCVHYIDSDGARCWSTCHSQDQAASATLGILRFHTLAVESEINRYLEEQDDE